MLKGNQKKIDINKDGKINKKDFLLLKLAKAKKNKKNSNQKKKRKKLIPLKGKKIKDET